MGIGDYIRKGSDSPVIPYWMMRMAVSMAATATNSYTDPDRIEFHEDERITFLFIEKRPRVE